MCSKTEFPLQRILVNERILCISKEQCHEHSYYELADGERRCGYCAKLYKVDPLTSFKICITEQECQGVIRDRQCYENGTCNESQVQNGKVCQNKCGAAQFRDNRTCMNTCSSGFYQFLKNGERLCVPSCDVLSTKDSETGLSMCVEACNKGEFELNSTCVGKCDSGYYVNRTGVLHCVANCAYFVPNDELSMRRCFDSCNQSAEKLAAPSSLGMYQCVDRCPADYPLVEAGICTIACVSRTYQNTSVSAYPVCVTQCPGNRTQSQNVKSHAVCVGTCGRDQLFVPDGSGEAENVGECVSSSVCPEGMIPDKSRKCVENCPFFTNVSGVAVCYEACPAEYPRGVVVSAENATLTQVQCFEGCLAGSFTQSTTNLCLPSCGEQVQYQDRCYDACPAENAQFVQFNVAHAHFDCVSGCSATFTRVGGRRVCGTCPTSWKRRRSGDLDLECVQNCPGGEFSFQGRCLAECPAGTFVLSDLNTSECYSSCPDGYVPNGAQCDVRLTAGSKVKIGLISVFAVLFVAALVLWVVLKVYLDSKDSREMLKTARMKAIQQMNM